MNLEILYTGVENRLPHYKAAVYNLLYMCMGDMYSSLCWSVIYSWRRNPCVKSSYFCHSQCRGAFIFIRPSKLNSCILVNSTDIFLKQEILSRGIVSLNWYLCESLYLMMCHSDNVAWFFFLLRVLTELVRRTLLYVLSKISLPHFHIGISSYFE